MKIIFEEHQENLFKIILSDNQTDEFLILINKLKEKGHTKEEIYHLFLDFHTVIQIDERTKKAKKIFDFLSDFMDGFTAWGKENKILPDEPDL